MTGILLRRSPHEEPVIRIVLFGPEQISTIYVWKAVEIMCRAFEEVREQGREQGREQTQLADIMKLMKNLKLTAQQAMDVLEIPNADREKLLVNLS